jgi:L-seryl-tRNA(Ser) seleniumtransferase
MNTFSKRDLPAIERLLTAPELAVLIATHGQETVKSALRELQAEVRSGDEVPAWAVSAAGYATLLQTRWASHGYRPVFNLTGTIIHTNLGRALLDSRIWRELEPLATRPMNLEFDLESGQRGHRDQFVAERLAKLCGAEAATVTNNGAAALLLILNTFAPGKNVPVSRGELIEIGGSFRLPEIMARSGAALIEVGTTNRTRIGDFARVAAESALLLKVHPSNYHIEGFTESATNREMAELAGEHNIPLVVDLGSGALVDLTRFGLPHEPTPFEVLREGADLVSFSGDKLLGSIQAGLIVGRRDLIDALNKNPLKRALRCDKVTLALLDATLRLYETPDTLPERLPLLRTLTVSMTTLTARAEAVARALTAVLPTTRVSIENAPAQIGSGSLPEQELPSLCVKIETTSLDALATSLRKLSVPVISRIQKDALWLDMRGADPLDELLAVLGTLKP